MVSALLCEVVQRAAGHVSKSRLVSHPSISFVELRCLWMILENVSSCHQYFITMQQFDRVILVLTGRVTVQWGVSFQVQWRSVRSRTHRHTPNPNGLTHVSSYLVGGV